jgi:hypothetical protein
MTRFLQVFAASPHSQERPWPKPRLSTPRPNQFTHCLRLRGEANPY